MTVDRLILAQSLLDEHFDNVYFKLDIAAASLERWPWILGLALALLLGAVGSYELPFLAPLWQGVEGPPLGGLAHLVVVALAGALGAALSRSLSALSHAGRIPEFLQGSTDWLLRLMVGAASAVGITMLTQAGLLPFEKTSAVSYALAFVAGFTDRLLTRAIDRTVEQAEG